MILDPLRPYLATIRIIGYVVILATLTISSCSYGKRLSRNSLYKAETDLAVCRDANRSQLVTIRHLQEANEAYATQGAKQAEKVAQAVKDAKAAEKRAQAQEKAFNKELSRAYKNNPDWSGASVPDDVKRLLQRAD